MKAAKQNDRTLPSRHEPNVVVECLTCRHTAALTREALSRFSIGPTRRLRLSSNACAAAGAVVEACWRPASRLLSKSRERPFGVTILLIEQIEARVRPQFGTMASRGEGQTTRRHGPVSGLDALGKH